MKRVTQTIDNLKQRVSKEQIKKETYLCVSHGDFLDELVLAHLNQQQKKAFVREELVNNSLTILDLKSTCNDKIE